jgi:hypothetical protein
LRFVDTDRRIQEIKASAELFEQRGFFLTASRIFALSVLLENKCHLKNIMTEFSYTLSTFQQEFGDKFQAGHDFRKAAFREINDLFRETAMAYKRIDCESPIADHVYSAVDRINHGKKMVDEIARFLKRFSFDTKEKVACFHLACYSYVITVEGVFDEMARILYTFYALKNGESLTQERIQSFTVGEINSKINPKLTVFKDWDKKRHIRNAISHATVYYDLEKDRIRFVDNFGSDHWSITLSWFEFIELLEELESSVESLQANLLLLKIGDYLFVDKAF